MKTLTKKPCNQPCIWQDRETCKECNNNNNNSKKGEKENAQ